MFDNKSVTIKREDGKIQITSAFNYDVIGEIKTIPYRKYVKEGDSWPYWTIPFSSLQQSIEILSRFQLELDKTLGFIEKCSNCDKNTIRDGQTAYPVCSICLSKINNRHSLYES